MIKKTCTKCKEEKDISNFSLQKCGVYRSRCNFCKNEDNKLYRLNNKEKDKKSKQNWKDQNVNYWKSYSNENKEKLSDYFSEYYINNKNIIINRSSKNYNENKDDILLYRKQYYENNKDTDLFRVRVIKNSQIQRLHFPHRYAWRAVLINTLKRMNTKKTDRTILMLGYSANDLKNHIESLFQEGMNWNNWGLWQIHHKKFVSQFDKDTPPNIVNALSNLIPLWKEDHKKIHKK